MTSLSQLIDIVKSKSKSKSKHPKLSDYYDQATQTEIKNSIYYNVNTAHATYTCCMPIKAARINFLNDKAITQEFKKICAMVAIPKNNGQHGHKPDP